MSTMSSIKKIFVVLLFTVTLLGCKEQSGDGVTNNIDVDEDPGTGTDTGYTGTGGGSNSDIAISSLNPSDYVWVSLQSGTDVYIDRSYTYTSVPTNYEGFAVLKTANDDKTSTSEAFISFEINQDATVYVAHVDNELNAPAWLSSWADIGESLDTTDRSLYIYKKDFPAGSVVLGGNYGAPSMYTVFIATLGNGSDTGGGGTGGGTGSASLSWNPPTTNDDTNNTPLTDLAGYNIYYSTTSGIYSNALTLTNPELSSYTIDNLTVGTYYFVITAYDLSGNESAYSNETIKNVN